MPDSSLLSSAEPFNGPLAQLFEMGGPVMMVLAALAVIGFVTFLYLMLIGAFYAPRLTRPLKRFMTVWQQTPADAQPETFRQQASAVGRLNPLLPLVLDTAKACQAQRDQARIKTTAARDAQEALQPFEAPLKIIEVIAALAPLLGLLGTVMGMIDAFGAMATSEGRANATQLSGGIYEALTTTAAGLVIAIPFAALAAWIEFRLRRLHATINSTLVTVLNGADGLKVATAGPKGELGPEADTQDSSEPQDFAARSRQRLAHATG
ncbi:MotA/TolQ/ExbB proton channel family protein [Marinobacter sediminum]|uniref:MotA/TolQ/ExbB proton channel family protein n=1 Tax=Marinobacter sediminum TaxID=256323 RepID=UPI00193A0F6A|nr:MotA/TolQ/ExbB proton channel family protein [Marinobacter sediminum]